MRPYVGSCRDTVCIDRKAGDYPIKVFTVEVGTRRPLGVGAGSIAVLASMPDDDAVKVIEALKKPLQTFPEALRRGILPSVRAARKAGYAVSDGLVLPSVIGVGVAIRDPQGGGHRHARHRLVQGQRLGQAHR